MIFIPEDTEKLVDQFLQNLNYAEGANGNGFLMLPEEMLREGFIGTPYRFDLTQDRLQRGCNDKH